MRFLTALFALFCFALARAENINRCTDKQGKVSYSTAPCPLDTSKDKTLEIKNQSLSESAGNTIPAWQMQEREFQRRRNDRLRDERYADEERARLLRQQEAQRERKELYERQAAEQHRRDAVERRRDEFLDRKQAPTAPLAPQL